MKDWTTTPQEDIAYGLMLDAIYELLGGFPLSDRRVHALVLEPNSPAGWVIRAIVEVMGKEIEVSAMLTPGHAKG